MQEMFWNFTKVSVCGALSPRSQAFFNTDAQTCNHQKNAGSWDNTTSWSKADWLKVSLRDGADSNRRHNKEEEAPETNISIILTLTWSQSRSLATLIPSFQQQSKAKGPTIAPTKLTAAHSSDSSTYFWHCSKLAVWVWECDLTGNFNLPKGRCHYYTASVHSIYSFKVIHSTYTFYTEPLRRRNRQKKKNECSANNDVQIMS